MSEQNTQSPAKVRIRFNASAAKESACLLRTWLTVIEGYKESVPNNDIVFGSAIHAYIKTMHLTNGNFALASQEALAVWNTPKKIKPKKEYMENTTYLLLTCQQVWTALMGREFKTLTDVNGVPLVEKQFSIPYYVDDKVEVTLEGTIDDLCKHTHGAYAVNDYKSTSLWDKEGYLLGYELSPQLMFYVMAVEHYGKEFPDSIFAAMTKHGVHSFVTGIFLAGRDKDVEIHNSAVIKFADDKMQEFRTMLHNTIMRLVQHVHAGTKPMREGMFNGACQTVYGLCKFFSVCNAKDETLARYMLKIYFKQTAYDPLNHDQ